MRSEITALVLTKNEAANIGRVLQRLSWLDRILVIDSMSTDNTVDIARDFSNVEVVQREFDTHAAQWSTGLSQVTTEWVLTLDADYLVSDELAHEIQQLSGDDENVVGYEIQFQYRIYDHALRASVYPARVVLFRRGSGSYYDDGHTQRLRVKGTVRPLAGLIYHDDRKSLSHWIRAQDRYAILEARHLLSRRPDELSAQDRLRRRVFFAAPAMFFYLLFGRGLILDGWPGWFYVAQRTIAELLVSMYLLIETHRLRATE